MDTGNNLIKGNIMGYGPAVRNQQMMQQQQMQMPYQMQNQPQGAVNQPYQLNPQQAQQLQQMMGQMGGMQGTPPNMNYQNYLAQQAGMNAGQQADPYRQMQPQQMPIAQNARQQQRLDYLKSQGRTPGANFGQGQARRLSNKIGLMAPPLKG